MNELNTRGEAAGEHTARMCFVSLDMCTHVYIYIYAYEQIFRLKVSERQVATSQSQVACLCASLAQVPWAPKIAPQGVPVGSRAVCVRETYRGRPRRPKNTYIQICVRALRQSLSAESNSAPQGMSPGGAYHRVPFSKSEACRGGRREAVCPGSHLPTSLQGGAPNGGLPWVSSSCQAPPEGGGTLYYRWAIETLWRRWDPRAKVSMILHTRVTLVPHEATGTLVVGA